MNTNNAANTTLEEQRREKNGDVRGDTPKSVDLLHMSVI